MTFTVNRYHLIYSPFFIGTALPIHQFFRQIISGRRLGQLEIAITILDNDSNVVFKDKKNLEAFKEELEVAIKLSIPEGRYLAIIEASDKLLPSVDVFTTEIRL